MRKDFMSIDDSHGGDETTFIEKYWTDIWNRQGGPKAEIGKISSKDEYKVIKPFFDQLPKGARILDGGCGLGDWTAFFTQKGFDCVGLDLSRETVAKLHTIFPDVIFKPGDIRHTEFNDNSLDAYFSWGVFEHFEDGMRPCIDEALRILKPGGYLFISVPYDNLRHALRAAGDWSERKAANRHNRRFYQWRLTKGELRDELSAGGFDIHQVTTIHKRQGVLRFLHHEVKLSYSWYFTRGLSLTLAPIIPGGLMAHMILAVAQKPMDS
ncbi:class I SAM-dependent methyltransferase [Magnetovibrio blakemorei]|uniref:Methyltransferase type 11 domain-containing protein n=1 Tax=Magnetovibrio blakemorei TaxID=28181 RepID=A0A1E5Q5X2_9PROT|nr:class I SAM-dependent methyltransferase [Magnetovibrio blakemorei]OEJ66072.1 hypothetical protein BEN30_13040 [Magnetovibrio blakemorei]OEJ66109.1 hypothetical protein BEN30_12950 [Magnetovibrio blakemorei]